MLYPQQLVLIMVNFNLYSHAKLQHSLTMGHTNWFYVNLNFTSDISAY